MSDKNSLEKNWKGALAGMALSSAPSMAQPQEAPQTQQSKPFDLHQLHPELKNIAVIESSSGKNVQHKVSSKGEADTAIGVVGLKPTTAHEEYLRSKHLQKLYPNLGEINKIIDGLKNSPAFYSAVSGSLWNRLRNTHGSSEKAAFAWRHGNNAAAKVSDDVVLRDPYVKKFKELQSQSLHKAEDVEKAISDLKPGKHVGTERFVGGHRKTFNYDHLLSPQHIKNGYSLSVIDDGPEGGLKAYAHHGDTRIGLVEANRLPSPVLNDHLKIAGSHVQEAYQGQGLGTALYEALYAHGKHKAGIKHIRGDAHSTMASGVHSKLAQKHGLSYRAIPNYGPGADWEDRADWLKNPAGPFDAKYRPYGFELKSEEGLGKDRKSVV
jgi:GNAT superfamily N-acetyltransferase